MSGIDQSPGVTYEARSGETWRDPYPMYAALRDHDPVHHVADGDHWVLSRFDDVFDAARDTTTYSSAQGLTTTYGEREKIGLDVANAAKMPAWNKGDEFEAPRLKALGAGSK